MAINGKTGFIMLTYCVKLMHLLFCSADPNCQGERESFWHLHLPSYSSGDSLWKLHCFVCQPLRQCLLRPKQSACSVQHCGVPIIESLHLQPKNQDCQTGYKRGLSLYYSKVTPQLWHASRQKSTGTSKCLTGNVQRNNENIA